MALHEGKWKILGSSPLMYEEPNNIADRGAELVHGIASQGAKLGGLGQKSSTPVGWNLLEQQLEALDSIVRDIQRKVNDQLAQAYGPKPASDSKIATQSPRLEEACNRLTSIIDRANQISRALDNVGGVR
jgi:hypothetical protein